MWTTRFPGFRESDQEDNLTQGSMLHSQEGSKSTSPGLSFLGQHPESVRFRTWRMEEASAVSRTLLGSGRVQPTEMLNQPCTRSISKLTAKSWQRSTSSCSCIEGVEHESLALVTISVEWGQFCDLGFPRVTISSNLPKERSTSRHVATTWLRRPAAAHWRSTCRVRGYITHFRASIPLTTPHLCCAHREGSLENPVDNAVQGVACCGTVATHFPKDTCTVVVWPQASTG